MSITLVRHTAVNVEEGICYGLSDVPLAKDFLQAAHEVRAKLPPRPWRVISSPALRCRSLAEFLEPQFIVDHRLLELNFGAWELQRWSEIPRDQIDLWSADFVNRAPPGGETFAELTARAEACIYEFSQLFPDENLVCVTHAGVIRALLALRQGMALGDAFTLRVEFGGVYPIPTLTTSHHQARFAYTP